MAKDEDSSLAVSSHGGGRQNLGSQEFLYGAALFQGHGWTRSSNWGIQAQMFLTAQHRYQLVTFQAVKTNGMHIRYTGEAQKIWDFQLQVI